MDRLIVAKKLADAAGCMDIMKNIYTRQEIRQEAMAHVEFLHDLAEKFAGDEVMAVYAPDERVDGEGSNKVDPTEAGRAT